MDPKKTAREISSALQIDASEAAAKYWWILLLRGAAAVVLGIILLIWPSSTVQILLFVFVTYASIDGLISLVAAIRAGRTGQAWQGRGFEAAVSLVSAAVVLIWPQVVLSVLGYLIGFAMLARGIVQIVSVSSLDQASRARPWLIAAGILSLIAGTIFVFNPRTGLYLFVWTLAIYGLTFGALLILLALQARSIATRPAALS